ncbi:MAG: HAD-IA family hydrolase [Halobacteriales archaeon]|nr:HAD-IA family hydrolase [Halobacteriales archaeon]
MATVLWDFDGTLATRPGLWSQAIDHIVTSATVGYEKPHPEIFRTALSKIDDDRAVMIGDNPVADIEGAHNIGLEAYLIGRHPNEPGSAFDDLMELAEHLGASKPASL